MSLVTPQIIQQGQSYHVQHGTDAGLFVQFYMESVEDEEASLEKGRPIFLDKEYVKIIPVGDKNTVVCRPVDLKGNGYTPPDNVRWPIQYAAFKNQQMQPLDGTPLEQWPPLTKSQVLMMKAVNVHTVEQLCEVSDQNLANLGMGARDLRDKAKAFIESASKGALPMAAQQKINDLEKQVEALKNQLSGFAEAGVKIETRGRKKKHENIIGDDTAGC